MMKLAKIGGYAVLLSAIAATSGCAGWTQSEAGLAQSGAYEFDVVEQAAGSDFPLAVRVMDGSTGQPVTNAEVFVVHNLGAGSPKSIPQTRWHRSQLKSDGRGLYLYTGDVPVGKTVTLTARVPGAGGEITGVVEPRKGSTAG